MSAPEHENGARAEQKSSIEIACNAKGEAQPKVKVYEGTSTEELDRMRVAAVAQYRQVCAEVRG